MFIEEMILEDYLKTALRDIQIGELSPQEARENILILTEAIVKKQMKEKELPEGDDFYELQEDLARAGFIRIFKDDQGREMVELTGKGAKALEERK